VLHVFLDDRVIEFPADQPLGVEDGIAGILGNLVLGGVADESFVVGESDIGGSGSVALIVGDDLDSIILPDTDAGVGGAEVDSDGFLGVFVE